jgi:hypothetical protein
MATAQTISQMIQLALQCKDLPQFRQLGRDAIVDNDGNVRDILSWTQAMTQGYLSFQTDDRILPSLPLPQDAQILLTPDLVLANPGIKGACATYSTLAATILLATNLPIDIYFTTLAADEEDPSEFSHVYLTIVDVDNNRIPLDCSHGTRVGWEYPKWFRKHNWLLFKGTNYPSIAGDEIVNHYNNLQKARGLGELGELGNVDWGGLVQGAENIGGQIAVNETMPTTNFRQQNADGSYTTYSSPITGGTAIGNSLLTSAGLNLGSISPIALIIGAAVLFMLVKNK